MTETWTQVLDRSWRRHQLRSPQRESDRPEESHQLRTAHGLRLLGSAPVVGVLLGAPPVSRSERGINRYLWVFDERGVPYIIEEPLALVGLALPEHTNLTGGGSAYLGGELWFASRESVFISGGSGRYPPVGFRQLEEAVEVFESFGCKVDSLGWDHDARVAKRYWEGSQCLI